MDKACPVILRTLSNGIEILSFSHPLAGNQIVKGTIELNETLEAACIRELREESGIEAGFCKTLGVWNSGYKDQIWGFGLMEASSDLPDAWEFWCDDDGGHHFSFFWQPLAQKLGDNWHPLFQNAILFINQSLTS